MIYAIDIVKKVVDNLGSTSVMFQRDGMVYVASEHGFGCVRHGVGKRYCDGTMHPAGEELFKNSSALLKGGKDLRKREKPFFEALRFGPDHRCGSLQDMVDIARTLSELPDGGKVRVLDHDTNYCSHKGGYAVDGLDVFLTDVHTVDRRDFLRVLQEQEDAMREEVVRRTEGITNYRDLPQYESLSLPDAMVITPSMLVSFPRDGNLQSHRDSPDSWTEDSTIPFHSNYGFHLRCPEVSTYQENPFKVHVRCNTCNFGVRDINEFDCAAIGLREGYEKGMGAVQSAMPEIQEFIEGWNELHNKAFALDIQDRKKLRKVMEESRV